MDSASQDMKAFRFYTNSFRQMPDYMGIYSGSAGGRYLIGGLPMQTPTEGTIRRFIDPELAVYALVFLLSDCVRYRQEFFWDRVCSGESTGALGLIRFVLNEAVPRFPHYILNRLFGEPFTFGSASYLS